MTNSEVGTQIQIHKHLTISLFLWPDKSTPKAWRFKNPFNKFLFIAKKSYNQGIAGIWVIFLLTDVK